MIVALKKLELLLAAPQATLIHLSCSLNFPHAQYLDMHRLTHKLIINNIRKGKQSAHSDWSMTYLIFANG